MTRARQGNSLDRRTWLTLLASGAVSLTLPGCQSWWIWNRSKNSPGDCDTAHAGQAGLGRGGAAGGMAEPIPRNIYVTDRSRIGMVNDRTLFTQELVEALNLLPHCQAVLLPPGAPIPGMGPQQAGGEIPTGPRTVAELTHGIPETGGFDEVWIVQVTDIQPFRPMRLCAIIERRQAQDGLLIEQIVRTWDAPVDDEPLAPSHFNAFILRKPPPRAAVEHHELSRLSPRTFFRNVAEAVALELTAPPPLPE